MKPSDQIALFKNLNTFIYQTSLWFLRNAARPFNIENEINAYRNGVESLLKPAKNITARVDNIIAMSDVLDMVWIAKSSAKGFAEVSKIFAETHKKLDVEWLIDNAKTINARNYWQSLAIATFLTDLSEEFRRIVLGIAKSGSEIDKQFESRFANFLNDIKAQTTLEISMLPVILRRLKEVK